MTVIALKQLRDRAPTLVTLYCVRRYWSDRGALAEGPLEQFHNMEAALRVGQHAAKRAPAVKVFRVRGNVAADYWEDPVTVAKFGDRAAELSRQAE